MDTAIIVDVFFAIISSSIKRVSSFLRGRSHFRPKLCQNLQGSLERAQKWLDLAEIWYACSLSEYLGVFFFHFWALGPLRELA